MAEVAEREVERWPRDEPVALHPRLQGLTLEIILRAVFGLDAGARLERLRELLTGVLDVRRQPGQRCSRRCSATSAAARRGRASLRMRARPTRCSSS